MQPEHDLRLSKTATLESLPVSEVTIGDWARGPGTREETRLGSGYQGFVHLYENDGLRLIIKIPHGSGLMGWLRRKMIRNEYRAYRRLDGLPGVPHCYGLAQHRFLILEYVEGPNAREATEQGRISDAGAFYDRLKDVIESLHERGVSHADLKKRDNILVGNNGQPCLIDFGMAVLRPGPGFHPWSGLLFRIGCRLDLNAWVKHKYQRDYDAISLEDQPYYRPMVSERMWRPVRRFLRSGWRRLRGQN